jgi:hypothetical protein
LARPRKPLTKPRRAENSDRSTTIAQGSSGLAPPPESSKSAPFVAMIKKQSMEGRRRLGADGATPLLPVAGDSQSPATMPGLAAVPSVEDRANAAIGCKTSEVALAILTQVVGVEQPNFDNVSEQRVDELLANATAMLGELQPTNATEACSPRR